MNRPLSVVALALALLPGCQSQEPSLSKERPAPAALETEASTPAAPTSPKDNAIPTEKGDMVVTPLEHGSLRLTWQGRHIFVDPTMGALDTLKEQPSADLVLVTHIHGDHLDPKAIARVRGPATPVIAPQSVADQAGDQLPQPSVMSNGDTQTFLNGEVTVTAVEMYNLKRKRDNGELFHPRGRGNGYVLELGGARIYISGDTECTPEMKALKDIDAAFVCMNLPYTMTVEEAAECIGAFKPGLLFPYHHRGQDPTRLESLLGNDSPVELRLLEWYPKGQ